MALQSVPAVPLLDWLKVGLPFIGALLGAVLGTPLIEVFKDRLLAGRQWKIQRDEIVSTLRLLNGVLYGFNEVRLGAFNDRKIGRPYAPETAALFAFYNLDIIHEQVPMLSRLHPKSGDKEAAGQYLIKHLFRIYAHCKLITSIKPIKYLDGKGNEVFKLLKDDGLALEGYDQAFKRFMQFLYSVYAKEMDMNPDSLIENDQIRKLETAFLLIESAKNLKEMAEASKNIDSAISAVGNFYSAINQPPPESETEGDKASPLRGDSA